MAVCFRSTAKIMPNETPSIKKPITIVNNIGLGKQLKSWFCKLRSIQEFFRQSCPQNWYNIIYIYVFLCWNYCRDKVTGAVPPTQFPLLQQYKNQTLSKNSKLEILGFQTILLEVFKVFLHVNKDAQSNSLSPLHRKTLSFKCFSVENGLCHISNYVQKTDQKNPS